MPLQLAITSRCSATESSFLKGHSFHKGDAKIGLFHWKDTVIPTVVSYSSHCPWSWSKARLVVESKVAVIWYFWKVPDWSLDFGEILSTIFQYLYHLTLSNELGAPRYHYVACENCINDTNADPDVHIPCILFLFSFIFIPN